MWNSEVIIVRIERPFDEVYAFCAEPLNFGRWATEPNTPLEPLGGYEYLAQLPQGPRVVRFAAPNPYGVLDYQVYERGQTEGPTRPVRLIRNADGTELHVTRFQHDGMAAEQFASEVEWVRSDVQRLKALLEGG